MRGALTKQHLRVVDGAPWCRGPVAAYPTAFPCARYPVLRLTSRAATLIVELLDGSDLPTGAGLRIAQPLRRHRLGVLPARRRDGLTEGPAQ